MLLYTDIVSGTAYYFNVTGDEMISDGFKIIEVDDIAYEVDCQMLTIKEGEVDIGANASAEEVEEALEDGAMTVNNVIHSFRLQSTGFDKKSYMTYIKSYMKHIKKHLSETNPDRAAEFEAKATPFVKKILGNFGDYEFYTGESMNPEAGVVLLYMHFTFSNPLIVIIVKMVSLPMSPTSKMV